MTKRRVTPLLAALGAAVAGTLAAALVTGWDAGPVLIGLGCGLGAYLGVRWGNKNAGKTDAYRQEWLNKRKGHQEGHPPSTS